MFDISNNDITDEIVSLPADLAGRKIDGRTLSSRAFRIIHGDLADQLARAPKPAEAILLRNAAHLAFLCDRDTARTLAGEQIEEETYRRNVAALSAILIKLGMAAKSRDVTKRGSRGGDPFADAINGSQLSEA